MAALVVRITNRSELTVAVKIRLLRMGKIRNPQYRIVVADSRTKRDGRAIEYIGLYHPKEHPSLIEVNSDRALYWLSVGAQPSQPVQRLLEKTGDWQKFKGLPAPPPLLVAAERTDRRALYEAEAQAAAGLAEATTRPARKATKRAEPAAEAPAAKADAPKADAPKADAPKADAPKADAPKADAAPKTDAAPAESAPTEAAASTAPTAGPAASGSEESAGAGADAEA
jgi:small subunit ribosomal protein S16